MSEIVGMEVENKSAFETGNEVLSIEEDFKSNIRDFDVLDKQLTKKYVCDKKGDYMFLLHSNRMVVILLAPSHPIILKDLAISMVDFKVTEKLNRIDNKVSGKKKKGAQLLTDTSILCNIKCENGDIFDVRVNMVSKLYEINLKLTTDPQLLKRAKLGYIGIVAPRISDYENQVGKLLSQDEYEDRLAKRAEVILLQSN